MHPVLLGQSGNQVAQQAAVQAHYFRNAFPYGLVNLQSRNIALLQSDLVAFVLTSVFLSLIDVSSEAVDVRIAVQAEHLWKRRRREARLIIDAIPEAMARIKYIGYRHAVGRIVRTVIGECLDHQLLCCIIKFVPARSARSGKDEAWMLTSYFVRQSELSRLLRRQDVRPVFKVS
jgi:hypothetical protein